MGTKSAGPCDDLKQGRFASTVLAYQECQWCRVGSEPLYVCVSIGIRDGGAPKDTARNIESGGDFVVNLVTEELLHAMNVSAVDFPPDQSEMIPLHSVARRSAALIAVPGK